MQVRLEANPTLQGWSEQFNTHGLGEIIVGYDDGTMSSEYLYEYEVLLANGTWMNMREAFKEGLLICSNHNVYFREPRTDEERERGWFDD